MRYQNSEHKTYVIATWQGRINPMGGMGPALVGGQAGPLHVLRNFLKLLELA